MTASCRLGCPIKGLVPLLAMMSVVPFLSPGAVAQTPSDEQAAEVERLVRQADEQMRGQTAQGIYRMEIVRPDWSRTMRFYFWSEGTEKSFIRMDEPARDRGVAFLKLGREMWHFVPRVNRVIKIPPSMMLQSWMGSDFTNDDLVRESSIVDDYEHELLAIEEVEGETVYRIAFYPREQTVVAWDRIVEWIEPRRSIPIRAEYFNERGERVRTVRFLEVKTFGDRVLPAVMEVSEEKQPGHKTILHLEEMVFDGRIDASVFSQQNLKRGARR